MKIKELISQLSKLPQDADIRVDDRFGDKGVAACIDFGNRYILRNGIGALEGMTITRIDGMEVDSECVYIYTAEGYIFKMYHSQDCCEYVRIEDVNGNPDDLIGKKVFVAEKRQSEELDSSNYEYQDDSHTWTFYTIRVNGASVDIRWLGESNGYYSESVDVDILAHSPYDPKYN